MWDVLLQNLGKHVMLTTEESAIIQTLFAPRNFRKRQYIQQQGDIARYSTFIAQGIARTYEVDDTGQEHVVQFATEGWWVGDLGSFFGEMPTRYSIDCIEDTVALQITRTNLELLYERVPKMERHFRILLQNAFVAATGRVATSLTKNAAQRYDEFLQRFPEIEQRVPNHQIASYLGITPQSLSRIRSQSAGKK